MDALAGLLDGPRARQAFLLRVVMAPPWSIWVEDHAALTLCAVLHGEAWVSPPGPPGADPVRLGAGDIGVVRGPEPYAFANPPGTPPQVVALPGGRCTTPGGHDLLDSLRHGVRTWGTDGERSPDGTEVLIGAYEGVSELGGRLLAALPPVLTVPTAALESPLVEVLVAEIDRDAPGQQVVLDRMLDLLAVAVLRTWFASAGADAPGWFRAGADPVVGPALRLLQDHPAHPWSVAALAAEVGCSRATLARRFTELVGEPPMAFLTERRLALAADLLLEPGTNLTAIARQVGYASPFALSAAFKRVRGCSPQEFRAGSAA